MAISQKSVTLSNAGGGVASVTIGSEVHTFDLDDLKAVWDGRRSLDCLLFQFLVALVQAGVNPRTATLAQIKNAIEAQTYWWGN